MTLSSQSRVAGAITRASRSYPDFARRYDGALEPASRNVKMPVFSCTIMKHYRRLLFCIAGALFLSNSALAQDTRLQPYSTSAVLAGNVVLGAAIAAIGHLGHRDRSWRAAVRGGAAGVVVFAGKWIIAQNISATNIVGRQIAAVGSSGITNAAAGDGMLQHMTLVYGPVRFHVTTGEKFGVQPKIDLASSIELWRATQTKELSLNTHRSLTSGVPVFEIDSAKRTGGLGGSHEGGIVRFRANTPFQSIAPDILEKVIGHEFVHVAQFDFAFNAISEPIEARILSRIPLGGQVHRYFDLGLNVPLLSALNSAVTYERRPWEREARTLARW